MRLAEEGRELSAEQRKSKAKGAPYPISMDQTHCTHVSHPSCYCAGDIPAIPACLWSTCITRQFPYTLVDVPARATHSGIFMYSGPTTYGFPTHSTLRSLTPRLRCRIPCPSPSPSSLIWIPSARGPTRIVCGATSESEDSNSDSEAESAGGSKNAAPVMSL